ncbi:MAG: 2Fe-2S iron-sulfur cluster-binding protein [Treponema sp.]|nr:2Fe-2S iron-sulfur cluster-binding protein [Treponema sp.]
MKYQLLINKKLLVIDAEPDEKLADVLRRENFLSVKNGCGTGTCGSCTILLDDKAVPSCSIPIGLVQGNEIITMEYFSKTEIFADITKGFEKAGIQLCGYCNAGKYFAAYEVLTNFTHPDRKQIESIIDHINDCCVEKDILINGILYAFSLNFTKEKMRKNANHK